MPIVKKISLAGYSDVYNMEVKKHHNFSIADGFIVHNCDALRYWCSRRQLTPERPLPADYSPFHTQHTEPMFPDIYEAYLTSGW